MIPSNDMQREIYLASKHRRQRRDKWTAPLAFFWLFAGAIIISIIALFCNR